MAVTITSGLASTFSASTGRPCQGHLVYGVNNAKWYFFWLSSTQTLNISYSSDFITWTPSSAPFTLAAVHNSEGRNFGFICDSIASNDIVHMNSTYFVSTTSVQTRHARFKLDSGVNPLTGWTTTNSEAQLTTRNSSAGGAVSGAVTILDSNNLVYDASSYISSGSSLGDQRFNRNPTGDTTATWTPGTWALGVSYNPTPFVTSFAFADLGSGKILSVCDNASVAGSMTQLEWSSWSGSAWSSAATVFASNISTTTTNMWGMVGRTTTEVHVVALSNASSGYQHRIFNGTSWSNGPSIPTLSPIANSGIFLATDGTSVWMFVIASDKSIKYIVYNGTSWSASWTTLVVASANTRTYLSGYPLVSAGAIGLVWTELVGSTYNLMGATLGFPQSVSLGLASETGSAVSVGHTSTGTVSSNIGVASGTGSETAWSSAKGTGTSSRAITEATETGTAPSISTSVSGTVSSSIGVVNETGTAPVVTGANGLPASTLGLVSISGSASNLSASGTGTVSKSIGVASEAGTAPALSGKGSGTVSKSIGVASETETSPTISASGSGTTSRTPAVISITVSVIGVTYQFGGEITRSLGVASEVSTAVSVSRSVSGAATRSIGLASSIVTDASLSAQGTGTSSKTIGVTTETATAPNLIGLTAGLSALGHISATGTAPSVSASGSGTTSKSIGVVHETTSGVALSGSASGAVSRNLPVASISGSSLSITGAPSGAASRSLVVAHETTTLGSLGGALSTTTIGIGTATATGIARDVGTQGSGDIITSIGAAYGIATDSSIYGRLDLSIFRVDHDFVSLIN